MIKVVITGAGGFIGRNLVTTLNTMSNYEVLPFTREDSRDSLMAILAKADFVFHLAGVNRPKDPVEFHEGNVDFSNLLIDNLKAQGRPIPLLITSSTQAALNNPYGSSKRRAEDLVRAYGEATGSPTFIYRLPNVFGKWSRPNYNSVVATFCDHMARGLSIEVHDPSREMILAHIDDVVAEFISALRGKPNRGPDGEPTVGKTFTITLGELATRIQKFPQTRNSCELPEVGDELTRRLYSMYLSYLPEDRFGYELQTKRDPRGWLAEVLRSQDMGQIFVSVTRPGISRGNHWHHTKTEKFLVVSGQALVQFRSLWGTEILDYAVTGDSPRVLDIPPGYTHSITNTGETDLVTLFWASEPFDPLTPDTYALPV